MGLSCECTYYDGDGWVYFAPEDYDVLWSSRRKRCCSCGELIDRGSTVVRFDRSRPPVSEVEDRIIGGDDVELASWFMCERCGDLYFSLTELGFCILLGGDDGDMRALVKEYAELYGGGS